MSGHRNFKELEAKMSPDSRARSDAKTAQVIREMPLQQLRAALSLTQTTLAETLGVTQSEVSKLERRTDIYMSTLRKFIEAMGGTLEIRAVFADGRQVRITQFGQEAETKEQTADRALVRA